MTDAGTASPDSTRRLAAVLHADVAGISRLMAEDDTGTHARLMAARTLIFERIAAQRGRVAGTAGDAVLAVFDSVVDALQAALDIQAALAGETAGMRFRIGLNLGDIIVDGDDVFGTGVNVAARIEALADPGGIAVSAAVRDQVGTRLPVTFENRGRHRVKNVDTPLHIFAVHNGADTAPTREAGDGMGRGLVLGGLALAALGAGLFGADRAGLLRGASDGADGAAGPT